MDYIFTVNYTTGSLNKVADPFSHNPVITLMKLTNSMQIHRHSFFEFAIYLKLKWQIVCFYVLEQLKKIADKDVWSINF